MIRKSISAIPPFEAGDKTILKEILHPKNDGLDLTYSLAHAVLEQGTSSVPHILDESEVYFFLQGKGGVFINNEMTKVTTGDIIYIPPGVEQYVVNEGSTALKFLCIVSPPWSAEGETILEMD